jgi:chemotaxis protein histidine kinase CheA
VRRHLAAPAAGIPAWAAGRALARLRGAAALAGLGGAARAFHALGRYLDEALAARAAPALAEGLDDWLEAVEGLALYLDAVLEGRSDAAGLLAGAQACVARLPLGPEMAVEEAGADRVEEVDLAAPPREAPPAEAEALTALEETMEEIVLATPDPAQAPLPPALAASLAAARERFARLEATAQPPDPAPAADGPPDREVSAVFREEVAAIAESLQEALAAWEREPDAPGPPRRAARALRTLRSASRLAGAVALGDLAWACTRLVEGEGMAGGGEALRSTLREVQALLPAFAAAFAAGEEPPEAAALAERLGEEACAAGRG